MMQDEQFSFERLTVWQKAMDYAESVYRLMAKFPKEEKFDLCDQLRRCVTSIPSNLAEGSGRSSYKEKIHFIEISYGSLMESFCQLQIANRLDYISEQELNQAKDQVHTIAKLLNSLRYQFQQHITS